MEFLLESFAKELGDGEIIRIGSGEFIFKFSSFKENPIVKPQDIELTWYEDNILKLGAVFNGGAELFEDNVVLLPRCHHHYKKGTFYDERLGIERTCLENYISEVNCLKSADGIHFEKFNNVKIKGDGTDHKDFIYGIEDIRIIKQDQRYILIGCGKVEPAFKGKNADRIAVYSTRDFRNINYNGIIKSFDSRNAVLFSEPVDGNYYILLRFNPNIHIDILEAGIEQILNPSKYEHNWQKIYNRKNSNLLLKAGDYPHEKEKIGPGTQIINTEKGWLLIYHAVGEIGNDICKSYGLSKKINRGYSVCIALLDKDNPKKILCRTKNPVYIPSAPYELYGNDKFPVDVPAVVFPVGAFVLKDKLVIYAGAGDKYVILLSCNIKMLIEYLFNYCIC